MQQVKQTVEGYHTLRNKITQDKTTESYMFKEARDPKGRLLFYEYVGLMKADSPDWKNREEIYK